MHTVKLFYIILFLGLVLYFLLYSILIKKLPVVKIYFEDDTPMTNFHLQQDFTSETLAGKMEDSGPFSAGQGISARADETAPKEITSEKEGQDARREVLLSFLEGLGIPKVEEVDISTRAPARVNPNGASLPKLMKKIDESFDLSIDKACPTSHLTKGKFDFVLVYAPCGECK